MKTNSLFDQVELEKRIANFFGIDLMGDSIMKIEIVLEPTKTPLIKITKIIKGVDREAENLTSQYELVPKDI